MPEDGPRKWHEKVGFIVVIEIFYLLALFIIALFYLTDLHNLLHFALPDSFGPIPVGVPWFGSWAASSFPYPVPSITETTGIPV